MAKVHPAEAEAKKGMYELLQKKYAETNWNDRKSIHEYNEYARRIRKEYTRDRF